MPIQSAEDVDEEKCFAHTFERKYYFQGDEFIKRSLRPSEFQTGYRGLHIPRQGNDRLKNEAASLRFIRDNTEIPVPTLRNEFEHDGAYYIVTEYVEGVNMQDLADHQKLVVRKELQGYLDHLKKLTSTKVGGPSGLVVPPYRVDLHTENDSWRPLPLTAGSAEYVFCHNDISQSNVLVDPETLRIKAIIDWEYAGFWPDYFEWPFYQRPGPSSARNGEVDDSDKLLRFLQPDIGAS